MAFISAVIASVFVRILPVRGRGGNLLLTVVFSFLRTASMVMLLAIIAIAAI